MFLIPEQQEQAVVPAHRASLLLSVDFPITLVFDLPEPPPSVYSCTISTGNLNLLTGQKIKCERRHPACFCKKRLALLKKKEKKKKKKNTPLGFLGKQIAPPTTTEKRAAHLCSLPVPSHNTRYDLCQTCATGLFNSVQSMIKHCAM